MLNPTENHGREKGFFLCPSAAPPPMASGSLSVYVCPCMLGREKQLKSEWRCHCQTWASAGICFRMTISAACVRCERVRQWSAFSPPQILTAAICAAGQKSIFHPFRTGEVVSSPTHMFLIRCVFILPHDVLCHGSLSSHRYWN